ncbi:ribose utilization transcriptional repressor RbsR [uncultured Enterococcus sp.]|uniref:ribose utilization transcriptional repressor RbsR n=1 Tax=uncultured Enterococcus sp. TaxID=167972 RepID=UPI002609F20A|nr:LacI family DNA-binding transcriptional regulator [uncultured Enterococcus sp.]
MKKKVTIKEVAAKSGVSIATVSQILNGNAEKFSPKTVEKVMNAKSSLDYQPDYFAQRMVMKKSKTIGVMIPDITNPFFAILLKGIEKVVYGQKYIVMLCDADFSVQKESEYLQELIRRGVDGFIIASSTISNQALREQLSKNQIPYIVLDQKKSEGGSDEISTDDFTGGVLAANHLRELGHEKVAVIGPQDAPSNIQTRIEGFKTVYPEFLFVNQPLTREGGKQAAEKIIASEISAVFALNDEIALGLMYQLKHLGKVIPNDYSIVGYDNSPMSEYVTPALTTVSQPIFELGQIAAELLLERIRAPKQAWARKVLPVELIKRNTTAHLK